MKRFRSAPTPKLSDERYTRNTSPLRFKSGGGVRTVKVGGPGPGAQELIRLDPKVQVCVAQLANVSVQYRHIRRERMQGLRIHRPDRAVGFLRVKIGTLEADVRFRVRQRTLD